MLPQNDNLPDWLRALEQGGPAAAAAMTALFSAYSRPVFREFRAWGAGVEDAGDLTQIFFTKLLSKQIATKNIREPVAYLYEIAHNVFRDWRRLAVHREKPFGVGQEGDDQDRLAWLVDSGMGADENTLPVDDAYELALRYLRERHPENFAALILEIEATCSHGEMATMLGIPVGTFNQRLSAGKKKLREVVAKITLER